MKRVAIVLAGAWMACASAEPLSSPSAFGISPSDSGEAMRYMRCEKATLDFDTRIAACSQLMKDKGPYSFSGYVLAQIYLEKNDRESAGAIYDHLVAATNDAPYAHIARGVFRAANGDYDAAMKDAAAGFAGNQDDIDALTGRCFIRAVANRELPEGLADCDAALAKNARDPNALGARGFVLFRMGRMAEATAALSDAIDRDRHDAASLYLRGLAQKAQGNDGGPDFAAANRIDPHIADLLQRYGVAAP